MTADAGLDRFVSAQEGVYATALAELRRGRKQSHWMWFVFPQVAGLGRSETARFYALSGMDEARAYLAHPLLGARLREAVAAVTAAPGTAEAVLGPVDAVKLRSSLTLFEAAADGDIAREPFRAALRRFGWQRDPETLKRL